MEVLPHSFSAYYGMSEVLRGVQVYIRVFVHVSCVKCLLVYNLINCILVTSLKKLLQSD